MGTEITFNVDEAKFFDKAVRCQTLPRNDALKQVILKRLMREFEQGRTYTEAEVNERVGRHFRDYTTVRRELLDFGYMRRNPLTGEWTVLKKELTREDYLAITTLRRHARDLGIV